MASLPSLAGFMNSIVKVDPHEEIKQYERMVYLFSKEFNWSLSDFNSAPIPLILSLLDSVEKPIFNTIYTVAPNEINPVLIGYRPFESGYANLNSPYYDDKDISFDVYWRAIGTSDMGHSMMTKEFIEDELHHCLHSWLINRGY